MVGRRPNADAARLSEVTAGEVGIIGVGTGKRDDGTDVEGGERSHALA